MNYLVNWQTTKVMLTKGVPNKSGNMQVNKKKHCFVGIYSISTRGTDVAKVEGLVTSYQLTEMCSS